MRISGNKLLSITVWNLGADSQNISAVCYVIGVRCTKPLKGIHQFLVIYLRLQKIADTFVQKLLENVQIIER